MYFDMLCVQSTIKATSTCESSFNMSCGNFLKFLKFLKLLENSKKNRKENEVDIAMCFS